MSWFKRLKTEGLTNQELGFTLPELHTSGILVGMCTNEVGTVKGEAWIDTETYIPVFCAFVTKDRSKTMCPECGYALFWKRISHYSKNTAFEMLKRKGIK